ncbi:hypothetical protein [Actinomycetospora soli]|uniref:hypothetical protein n=1 Tax=Actinomycetospora soli TaxID=2893887 RepID=UPI001E47AF3E|nr:hypothetical protein [Actinomycetospora soli]MCD2191726.1 hypothetical protein [Actinomycetospora soli]
MSEIPTVPEADEVFELPRVQLTGDDPNALADLYSIRDDIIFAFNCVHAYISIVESNQDRSSYEAEYSLTRQSLWNSSIISYRRAFKSGKALITPKTSRFSLDGLVASFNEDQRRVHDELLETASQHVAHRVGPREQAQIFAFLAPRDQAPEVRGVSGLNLTMVGPIIESAHEMATLCGRVLEALDSAIDARETALLNNARTRDINDLYAKAVTGPPAVQQGPTTG